LLCGVSGTTLGDLAETLRPVIGRRFPLEEALAGHRQGEAGRKRGSPVLTLDRSLGISNATQR